jgi:hypothetical protein
MPERFQSMLNLYHTYEQKNGVLAVSPNYDQIVQVVTNGIKNRFGSKILVIILASLILLMMLLTAYSVGRRRL